MRKIKSSEILERGNSELKNNFFRRKKFLLFCFLLFACSLGVSAPLFAQEDQLQNTAPPPMKVISKLEKSQLAAEPGVKKRTKLALELMNVRLTKAESFNNEEQYSNMFDELGGFHALVDDTLNYLSKSDTDSGKVLDNFKRLEMNLRVFSPRLEIIRRDLPLKYEMYVRTLIIYLRQARTKAVEPLFDNSIVSDVDSKKP